MLLIEDKTGTTEHGIQLKMYYAKVIQGKTEANKVGRENILPIFLKTGNQSLYNHMRIENSTSFEIDLESRKISSKPYKVFDRGDFLKVVEPYNTAYPILNDFTDYLKSWERDTQRFEDWQHDVKWESRDD